MQQKAFFRIAVHSKIQVVAPRHFIFLEIPAVAAGISETDPYVDFPESSEEPVRL
jgi:hypothetical protein